MIAGGVVALVAALVGPIGDPPTTALLGGPRADAARVGVEAPVADTVRVRRRAVRLSDAYVFRLKVHKVSSYAMLPMFAFEYVAGDQLFKKSSGAPQWAKDYHGVVAGGIAALFGINTLTGGLNWWETRKQSSGLAWRTTHASLMLLADAGFMTAGLLADQAENSADRRSLHRSVAVSSMSLATISYLMMLKPLRRD